MTSIGILGIGGRMGAAIAAAAAQAGVTVAGGTRRGEDPAATARAADVLIDFTLPQVLDANLAAARAAGTPIVIGTTGLTPAQHAAIDAAVADIAVLQTANTSLGVAVLRDLVERAARALGPDWDAGVIEMHHRAKRDAPSGTGLLLADAAARGRGGAPDTIQHASLRGGTVAGDHSVVFAGDGERIELVHRAESRAIFARGALRAALWLADRPAGRYGMADVLGL